MIVAVSGGPDSMTLLVLLDRLRVKHDFALHVAHVNYGLRGRDSDRDEALVHQYCVKNHIPISVLRPRNEPTSNIEAELRDIRYTWFESLRQQHHFDIIVTAHTMNDLAETVLLNLIRGAGTDGLSPFQRLHSHLSRPLLPFTRAEIEGFVHSEQIPFRLDRSNLSQRFTRNRIRHELLPLLKTFNPNIIETLAQTAKRLGKKARNQP